MLKSARLSPENTADWVMQKIIPTHVKMVLAGIAFVMTRSAPRGAMTKFEQSRFAGAALGYHQWNIQSVGGRLSDIPADLIFDFSVIVLPSTTKVLYPQWWRVLGFFGVGSFQAAGTSRIKILYLLTMVVSTTLHSRLARHSATRGGLTLLAGTGVRPKASNLSGHPARRVPICTTF
jgi:hypothetical protein